MYRFKLDCLEIVYFIVNPKTSPKDMEIWPEDSGDLFCMYWFSGDKKYQDQDERSRSASTNIPASIQVALLQSVIFRIQSPETRWEVSFWEKLQVHVASPIIWTSSILTNTMYLTQRVISYPSGLQLKRLRTTLIMRLFTLNIVYNRMFLS